MDDGGRFPSATADWHRRRRVASDVFVPWVDAAVGLGGRTVLEYGCGAGPVSAAFMERAGRYVGLDIDAADVGRGRALLAEGGLHPELRSAPSGDILDALRGYAGEVDVLLLYAVLEHLSVDERLALLAFVPEVVRPDGALVIIETPNRLTPWDYHTTQLPFLYQLPDELARAYAQRSQRPDFLAALGEAQGPEAAREMFVRWGRGVSFHELELSFGDLGERVVASGWDAALLGERHVYREELALQRVLDRDRPDVSPAFSRYWLDLILRMQDGPPVPQLRPWPLQTTGAPGVAFHASEVLSVAAGAVADLRVPATRRVLVGAQGAPVELAANGVRARATDAAPDETIWCDLRLDAPVEHVTARLDAAGTITCVLYER